MVVALTNLLRDFSCRGYSYVDGAPEEAPFDQRLLGDKLKVDRSLYQVSIKNKIRQRSYPKSVVLPLRLSGESNCSALPGKFLAAFLLALSLPSAGRSAYGSRYADRGAWRRIHCRRVAPADVASGNFCARALVFTTTKLGFCFGRFALTRSPIRTRPCHPQSGAQVI